MSSNSSMETIEEWIGQVVPRQFSPGFVVLSYLISYIGSWTTLELINKKTAGRGLYNWFLLVGSSISMGGIAIWCMHYIGNRAIILGGGESVLQIAYNPGFTALSFFVPIIVLLIAFYAVGSNEVVSIIRVTFGGTLAGIAICGMHYLGQAGISNYTCIYQIVNVVGSAIIAIVASITALTVFFVLRSTWANSLWKRGLTAVILAGAVSGMHWLASVGTQYQLRRTDNDDLSNLSNNSTVIVVIVLSFSACTILLMLTVVAGRRRAQSADRAQKVLLASAVFDGDGRIMVSPEGLLPNQTITSEYIEKSFDDVFGISHPVFLWIFRLSRNWSSIATIVPGIQNHLSRSTGAKGVNDLMKENGDRIDDYAVIFKQLFIVAAAELAAQLNEPLENIGTLYDEILNTGMSPMAKFRGHHRMTPSSSVDLERDGSPVPVFGRGQLLFLVRCVNRREADHLAASGFRFAAIQNVARIVSRSMQINTDDVTRRLEDMREYAKESPILDAGVHVACFAIRASLAGGFDVVVRKDARNLLPSVPLSLDSLDSWQLDYMSELHGWSVVQIQNYLRLRAANSANPKKEQVFAVQLDKALAALQGQIEDSFFQDAQLICRPVMVPCQSSEEGGMLGVAQVIAFRIIVPIHHHLSALGLTIVPLNFFKTQQHLYKHSPAHDVFARKIHRELAPIINTSNTANERRSPLNAASSTRKGHKSHRTSLSTIDLRQQLEYTLPTLIRKDRSRSFTASPKAWNRAKKSFESKDSEHKSAASRSGSSETSSEANLVENQNVFGGIMVSQEISVDVKDAAGISSVEYSDGNAHSDGEGSVHELVDLNVLRNKSIAMSGYEVQSSGVSQFGTLGVASTETQEAETYVDQLFAFCVEGRQ